MTPRRDDERGSVLVTVLGVMLVLAVLAVVLGREAVADLSSTADTVEADRSLNAAHAAVDDYIAKLTEDAAYFDHYTHPAESTRRATDGTLVAAGSPWDSGTDWTYTEGKDAWRDLGDGLQYNLEVEPQSDGAIRIEASGRLTARPSSARTVEAVVRPASVADFQMIASNNISYGETAHTWGKIYATKAGTTRYSVTHKGKIHADVYAEEKVITSGTTEVDAGVKFFTRDTTPLDMPPIQFSDFTQNKDDIEVVAGQPEGLYVEDDAGAPVPPDTTVAFWLTFRADGKIEERRCTVTSVMPTDVTSKAPINRLALHQPTCGAMQLHDVPANGAIFVKQDVILDGVVQGRVTVSTSRDVIIASSLRPAVPGQDVIGAIAGFDVLIPSWAPTTLDWQASTISIAGAWKTYSSTPVTGSKLTFTGSTATFGGGRMNQYENRTYNYDRTLRFLQPPYWPVVPGAYTTVLFREISD